MKKFFLMGLALWFGAAAAQAQSLWTSAEMKIKLSKKWSTGIEAEYRTLDGFDGSERWAGTVYADYKVIKYLKLSGGYTFMGRHSEERTTSKGNIVDDYWLPRHRLFVAATGSIDVGRFTFSLRERYQYTHSPEKSVAKWDEDGNAKSDEVITAKDKSYLRSRLKVDYNIRNCPLTPFVSAEIYNSLNDGFSYHKSRYTAGTDIKINKKHSLSVFYRYIDHSDDDEDAGHIIGIGYQFKL